SPNQHKESRTMTDYHELRDAAQAATEMNFDTAEIQDNPDGEFVECPCCSGEGTVDLLADYCNFDGVALGVQFYGVGEPHQAAERYYRAANPKTVLAMLGEIDDLKRQIAAHQSHHIESASSLPVNRFGVAQDYFTKNLNILARDMANYTPAELARSLG